MASFDLVEPRSLEEAIGLLDPEDPAVRPVGGGTALMLMMKAQIYKPQRLVCLRRLGGRLSGIAWDAAGSRFRIGALTTFAALEHSPEIAAHLPVVPRTMTTLANVRVRNVATVGGNIAHADPHLDLPPVWLSLGARVLVIGPAGERTLDVADVFAGYYETTLANDELIVALDVPVRPGWRSTYVKVTTRAQHDWPALGIALSAAVSGRVVTDLRLVLSAALDKPTRLVAAEAVLRGAEIDDAVLRRAGDAAVAETEIVTDSRGSADYKQHLLRVHLGRTVRSLMESGT
ncbi:FAD binding domain-containing protein [Rhodoplanes roseus]|uniref:Molybdopterin dehydrogenase n=1 Tax=Rhodoplanes roseus TaxID=29409 RepID=A0A327KY85_9BRAD|nr:xanthine dehydrogenase family protein subunit M [Rhodoplanes roseus]RAI42545.1 molybdopterin dehydrogenase [Rhodoplanes roseus]